jgi:hypothetical protein
MSQKWSNEVVRQFPGRKTLESKKIRSLGPHAWETTQVTKEAKITYEGTFHVEIDIEGIIKMLTTRAGYNASGKSAYLGGLVKAVRLGCKEVAREVKEYPVSEHYEVVA